MTSTLQKSISFKLIKVVFSIYFAITFLVTALHIGVEYYHTRKAIVRELAEIEETFRDPLTQALWELDRKQLQGISFGIYRLPIIVGIQVVDGNGNLLEEIGKNSNGQNIKNLISHQFPIEQTIDDRKVLLANIFFFSDTSIVIDRIKLGFLMIILNSIIKTAVLLILLFWAFRKYLHRPFSSFINQIRNVQLNNIDNLRINLDSDDDNELRLIETTFNDMLVELEQQKTRILEIEKEHQVKLIEKVQRKTRALAAEKNRLFVTLRAIGDGVITIDAKKRIILMNRVAEKYIGWTQHETIGKNILLFFNCVDEKSAKKITIPFQEKSAHPSGIERDRIYLLTEKNGSHREISLSCSPIFDFDKKTIGYVLAFRDVSGQKNYEDERIKEITLESITSLAAGVAHDYNNILTAIIGNISLASSKLGDEDEIKPLLANAQNASLQAKSLTQQLLSLSGENEPIWHSTKLEEVIKSSIEFNLQGSNIKCIFHFEDDLWPIKFDPDQMSKAISNLTLNAKAAMKSRPNGTLELRASNQDLTGKDNPSFLIGKYVVIQLVDQGVGIPKQDIQRIFNPYYSTKSKNSTRGTGLGLSIVHSIISNLRGSINVSSTENNGTTVSIFLPVDKQFRVPKVPDQTGSINAKKILVMDDEIIIQDIVSKMLLALGHEVVIVSDGYEALESYEKALQSDYPFDVVILDLVIPDSMGGVETMMGLLDLDPEVCTLLSSGLSNDPVISKFQSYGFKGFIAKPYLLQELNAALKNIIDA